MTNSDKSMSVTVLTTTKWQPSVLHLLPFSRNDAGSTPSRTAPSNTTPLSYTGDSTRGFPVLAVTRSDKENKLRSDKENKLRSKSASQLNSSQIPSHSLTFNGSASAGKAHRLLRASSDRLSHRLPQNFENSKGKLRAKSDYGPQSGNKKVASTVRISVNDINDQILGKSHDDANSLASSESGILKSDSGQEGKMKHLPKPALKSSEGQWPPTSNKFWRSSATSAGDIELNKRRIDLELQSNGPGFRRVRRVKLNVNELPRSKTPIGENDPDKLNMKHVIAFLQSSGKNNADGDEGQQESYNEHAPFNVSGPPDKRLSNGSVGSGTGKNGVLFDQRHPLLKSYSSANKGSLGKTNVGQPKEITPHRYPSNRPKSYVADQGSKIAKNGSDHLDKGYFSERNRRNQMHDRAGSRLHYSDYKTVDTDMNLSLEAGSRPSSRHLLPQSVDPPEIHIPPSIRKIRDSNNNDKPFRLHRFLTLIPNGSESLFSVPHEKPLLHTTSKSRFDSKEASRRSVPSLSRAEKRASIPRRSQSETMYYLDGSGPPTTTPISKGSRRSKSKSAHGQNDVSEHNRHVNEIICLPIAHFEADSDEESGPFSTVPNARNRRALTLSAQGRAITDMSNKDTGTTLSRQHSLKLDKNEHEVTEKSTSEDVLVNADTSRNSKNANGDSDLLPNNKEWFTSEQPQSISKLPSVKDEDQSLIPSDAGSSPPPSGLQQETFLTLANPETDTIKSAYRTGTSGQEKVLHLPSPNKPAKGMTASPTEHVKLSLRKERNRTRVHTYMVDMEGSSSEGVQSLSPSSLSNV